MYMYISVPEDSFIPCPYVCRLFSQASPKPTRPIISFKGALAWYGKLTWESAHAWILKILYYLIVWGKTLIFMVRLSFYAIPLLIYHVMNDITIIP